MTATVPSQGHRTMTADTYACEGSIEMALSEIARLEFGLSLITAVHPRYAEIRDRIAEQQRKIEQLTRGLAEHREAA
jgi:hypothetical protein